MAYFERKRKPIIVRNDNNSILKTNLILQRSEKIKTVSRPLWSNRDCHQTPPDIDSNSGLIHKQIFLRCIILNVYFWKGRGGGYEVHVRGNVLESVFSLFARIHNAIIEI